MRTFQRTKAQDSEEGWKDCKLLRPSRLDIDEDIDGKSDYGIVRKPIGRSLRCYVLFSGSDV